MAPSEWWNVELEGKPDFEMAMKRIYAWYDCEIIDRAPVQFIGRGATDELVNTEFELPQDEQRKRWFDGERRVDEFIQAIEGKVYLGESFPIFGPDLGPDVYASFYGADLTFGESTSWSHPVIQDWADMDRLKLDMDNAYFQGTVELMRCALERCQGKFLVGYPDLHPAGDAAAAWRGPERLCMDLYDYPEQAKQLFEIGYVNFHQIFDYFDGLLKAHRLPSVTWLGVPSFGKIHVPSCDFSALISPKHFAEYSLPILQREVKPMTHNVYHVDGWGVAQHIDHILAVPEINAIQWVQQLGLSRPVMQWVPFIKKIQAAGKGVIVFLSDYELDSFTSEMDPKGMYLWVRTDNDAEQQQAILKYLERWH